MRYLLILTLGVLVNSSVFATQQVWKDVNATSAKNIHTTTSKQRNLLLDEELLRSQLGVSAQQAKGVNSTTLELPMPDGSFITVKTSPYSAMTDDVAAQYPEIQMWQVEAIDNPAISGVISLTSLGFHGMLLMDNGETVLIDPDLQTAASDYASYNKSAVEKEAFVCDTHETETELSSLLPPAQKLAARLQTSMLDYRLAVAATAEYTEYFGGVSNAWAAINITIGRINPVYKRDLGVELKLVDTTSVIFTRQGDGISTGYTDGTDIFKLTDENPNILDNNIGAANYDIGHVLSAGDSNIPAGGLAAVSAACRTGIVHKAIGATFSQRPDLGTFAIDFVAHELGHQVGATHTFNSTTRSCGSGNRQAETAYEPGSGSSVMAYAGICAPNNVASNSYETFHIGSIEQIDQYLREGQGACGVAQSVANNAPVIDSVTENLVVNAGESFTLTGSATDADGDSLTYSWDQFDAGTASDIYVDMGDNALFEVLEPSSSPSRTFPGRAENNREITFKFVVRDGKGGVTSKTTTVTVNQGITPPSPPDTDSSSGGALNPMLLLSLLLLRALRNRRKS